MGSTVSRNHEWTHRVDLWDLGWWLTQETPKFIVPELKYYQLAVGKAIGCSVSQRRPQVSAN